MDATVLPIETVSPAATRGASTASNIAWTLGGVATLFLLGKAIGAAGAGMPYGCWQLTGARAAASALVVGSLLGARRGNLGLFGALYALTLLSSHSSPLLLLSAALAGVAAWMAQAVISRPAVAVVVGALAFNLLLTLSGFVASLHVGAHERLGMVNFASATGIRILATLAVCGVVLAFSRKCSRR